MKGNIIGYRNTPTQLSTSGVWGLREQYAANRIGNWPKSVPLDTSPGQTLLSVKTIGVAGAGTSSFRDDSSNNFLVTKSGTATQGTFSPWQPNGYWSAYYVDGAESTIANNSLLKMGTGDYTFECWVMPRTTNVVLYSDTNGSNYTGIVIALYNNKLAVRASISGTAWDVDTFDSISGPVLYNRWWHVAVTRQGTTWRGFLNGVPQWTVNTATAGTVNQTGTHTIGKDPANNATKLGYTYLSNLRIIKGTALYTQGFEPPTQPFTAIPGTSLLCFQSRDWDKDNSGNNLPLTKNFSWSTTDFMSVHSPFDNKNIPMTFGQTGSIYFQQYPSCYLTFPDHVGLRFGTGDFTVEFWWASPTLGQSGIIFQKGNTYLYASNNYLYAYVNGSYVGYEMLPTTRANTWNHVALVRNGTSVRLYVNGVSTNTTANSADITDTSVFSLGAYNSNLTNGQPLWYLSNFRVVKGTAVYTTNFTPPTSPLTAIPGTSLLTAVTGNAIVDLSVNNLTPTLYGGDLVNVAARPSEENPIRRVTFPYGGSGYFDGNTSYPPKLSVLNAPALQMGTGDFTIEFWAQAFYGGGAWGPILQKGSDTGALTIKYNGNGNGFNVHVNNTLVLNPNSPLKLGQWNHVAVVRSGTTLSMYYNGTLVGSVTDSTNFNSTAPLNIGYDDNGSISYGNSRSLIGHLTGLRIVKGTAVYTGAFATPTSPPTAISGTSLLLNFDNAGIYDATGAGAVGTGKTLVGSSASGAKYSDCATYDTVYNQYNNQIVAYQANGQKQQFNISNYDFTIEGWFKLASYNYSPYLWDLGYRGYGTTDYFSYLYAYWTGTAENKAALRFVAKGTERIVGTTYLDLNTWYHIALSRTGGTTRLFINGQLEGKYDYDPTEYYGLERVTIGSAQGNGSGALSGSVEDFRFTRGSRYISDFTPPTGPTA